MFYENKAKAGGFAVKFGSGLQPGYLNPDNSRHDAFETFWANAPVTVPFTRLAWYPISPKWSLVGEVVGAEGKGTSPPEYRVGPRW